MVLNIGHFTTQYPSHSYVKSRPQRKIKEAEERIEELQGQVKELSLTLETIRETIASIDAEIHTQGATTANLRDNQRIRKLDVEIKATNAILEGLDLEQAAKDKRDFETKYHKARAVEDKVREKASERSCDSDEVSDTLWL